MQLIKVGEKTYYIDNYTNIGIYLLDNNNVFIIDSGSDKEAGRKIKKIIEENNWTIRGIINTHSNADHIGGNKYLQDNTSCEIYAYNIEKCIIENTILEPSIIYGGKPFKDIKNKFLFAKESKVKNIENNLPEGLEYFVLKGHFFDMIGIRTSDDVVFLADSLFSEETISKYHMFFIYDVKEYLNTLESLKTLEAKLYIPSHSHATKDIMELIEINKNKINELISVILDLCIDNITFEDILKNIFDKYNLNMNLNQYYLVGSTLKSYLSYMVDEELISYEFIDNKMYWKQIK